MPGNPVGLSFNYGKGSPAITLKKIERKQGSVHNQPRTDRHKKRTGSAHGREWQMDTAHVRLMHSKQKEVYTYESAVLKAMPQCQNEAQQASATHCYQRPTKLILSIPVNELH